MDEIWLLGCGGGGGWLAPAVAKMLPKDTTLVLWDGDTVEKKNLDRQFYTEQDIGKSKAVSMAVRLSLENLQTKIVAKPEYFDYRLLDIGKLIKAERNVRWIFLAVDNHVARLSGLSAADDIGARCIVGANEYTSAESYYYQPGWKDTNLDPRTYYPEIVTDKRNDPLRPHCTGEEAAATPQLAMANMMAAGYMTWLWWFWSQEAPTLGEDMTEFPVKVMNNFAKTRTFTYREMERGEKNV